MDKLYKKMKVAVILVLLTCFTARAQQAITGTVKDEIGATIPGASIIIKGTTTGTTSDLNGTFKLQAAEKDVIVISFIGYKTREIVVGTQSNIDVALASDITSLDEVVVVGYGEQKRSDITGAVASVPKDRLQNLPVTNLMYALQGSTAGLNISQGSSVPGKTGAVSIRGTNSITASTEPLYVLDGVIFFGSTNDINPGDIESIEVLKDASAVAIYGTRGSNGVILISTKRGKTGKPTVSYSGYTGMESIAHELTPMSPEAYVQKYADYKTATNNTSTAILGNTYEIDNYNAGKTTNWIDAATQPGRIQNHDVSLRGGMDNAKYYVNVGYLNQQGVVKGYEYKRFTFRSNLDVTPTDFLKLGTSIFYTNKNYDGGRMNLLMASAMSPYSMPYKADGTTEIYPMYPELLFVNPVLDLNVQRVDRGNNLNGSAYTELAPQGFLKGLKYRFQGSYALQFTNYSDYSGRNTNNLAGKAGVSNDQTNTWVLENLLTYAKDFNKHHLDFTALYSAQRNKYYKSNVTVNGFVNDELLYNNIGAGTSASWGSEASSYSLASQMGRVNYSYDSRYMLSVTTRRDGYSAFGVDANKFAVFPSVAAAWNMHNESFLSSASFIDQLKLRVSYGKTGNQGIKPYQTISKASATSLAMGGGLVNGVLLDDLLGNSHLKWESTIQTNVGVDFGFMNNRIGGTIDVFQSHTVDCILLRNVPRATGSTQILDNLGELQNKGLEITLRGTPVQQGDFKWETNLNFSTFKNKVIDLYGDKKSDIGNRWFIGNPLGVIYDYEKVGVWQAGESTTGWDPSAKPGDLKFKDQDGNGVIDANDKVVLGQTAPKWYGGITNTFHYKNFHLNIFIQTSQGALKNDVDASYADERGRRNIPAVVGYWTPENKSNEWPGLAYNNTRGYGYPMKNNYTRIKDITLSYTFPQSLISRARLSNLTAYVSARNVYTFTNWIGWDPESTQYSRGSDDWVNNYPYVRTISFGINVSL